VKKFTEKLAELMDIATVVLLFGYGAHQIIEGAYVNGALLFGVLGVWSISITLGKIAKLIEGNK